MLLLRGVACFWLLVVVSVLTGPCAGALQAGLRPAPELPADPMFSNTASSSGVEVQRMRFDEPDARRAVFRGMFDGPAAPGDRWVPCHTHGPHAGDHETSYLDRWIEHGLAHRGYERDGASFHLTLEEHRYDSPRYCFPLPEWKAHLEAVLKLEHIRRCEIDWNDIIPGELRFDDDDEDGDDAKEAFMAWFNSVIPGRRPGSRLLPKVELPPALRPIRWSPRSLKYVITY